MERCHLCEVVTGCVDYGYSLTPINVSKKNLPGLKRDTSQAVVETMQTQSDRFSRPGQNERKYGARNFGAVHFTWQARYFGARNAIFRGRCRPWSLQVADSLRLPCN